jgi:hypothetical protein
VHLGFADWLINNTRGQDPDLKEFLHAVIYARPEFPLRIPICKRMIGAVVKSAAWIRSASVEEVAQAIRPFFASLDEPPSSATGVSPSCALANALSPGQPSCRGSFRPGTAAVQASWLGASRRVGWGTDRLSKK